VELCNSIILIDIILEHCADWKEFDQQEHIFVDQWIWIDFE